MILFGGVSTSPSAYKNALAVPLSARGLVHGPFAELIDSSVERDRPEYEAGEWRKGRSFVFLGP